MTSHDERREVAARLRELAGRHEAVGCGKVERVLGLELRAYGCVYAYPSKCVRHLADLIEPDSE